MKVELMREVDYWIYELSYSLRVATDYTGRWRVVVTNGKPALYIECFTEKEESWFNQLFKGCPKTRKQVFWVHEDRLDVRCTEEFINECGCYEKD